MRASEIESINSSKDPRLAIHVYTLEQFDSLGYDQTQKRIREHLDKLDVKHHSILIEYLQRRIKNNEIFEPHKKELLMLILELDKSKSKDFKIYAYPSLYLISRKGEVLYSEVGFSENAAYKIDSLIQLNL